MRADTVAFVNFNSALNLEPIYVIEISFNSANTDLYYFTSHNSAALPIGALSIKGVVKGLNGTSQSVAPEKALATIGSLTFNIIDNNDSVSALQYSKLLLGKGLRGQRVRVYVGYEGLLWADYSAVTTQIIEDVNRNKDGAYSFVCADVQREVRKDIFAAAKTNLSQTVLATDNVINVYSTAKFEPLAHTVSYSDAPNQIVYYFKIKKEIIRATGKTSTTFTGCTRGVLNTKPDDHIINQSASADRRTEVKEHVYIELPAPKLAYAILTGKLIGQGSEVLPATWHLGINELFVRQADFSGIGTDLFSSISDSLGLVLRFNGLKKQDGKKFLEKELLLLMGCFAPVYSDGALGLKRMTSVLSKSGYVYLLDQYNVSSHSSLRHDMKSIHNHIEIQWNWLDDKKKYTRRNVLIDANSINIHGLAKPLKFSFRGLNGSRHSTETLGERFDSFRDRYAGPPLRMTITCLPGTNILEVGDIVRLKLPGVIDYNTGTVLDRAFEVQNVAINWITGAVNLSLFGSSAAATAISSTAAATVVPAAWYKSEGNNLKTYIGGGYDATTDYTLVGGVGHISATTALLGGVALTDAVSSIWYHDGDLVIDAGVIVSITQNVQLRVNGFLTINGEINGVGTGLAGATKRAGDTGLNDLVNLEMHTLGTSGFLGLPQSGGGSYDLYGSSQPMQSLQGFTTVGLNSVAPKLSFSVAALKVEGIPVDIRGTSGGTGHILAYAGGAASATRNYNFLAGGAGGAGGAGLLIASKGAAFGVNGKIDVSGGAGGIGDNYTFISPIWYAGSGAGGAPGAVYFAIDGVNSAIPNLDNIKACYGNTPTKGNPVNAPVASFADGLNYPLQSYYIGTSCPANDLSGFNGAARISFVVGAEAPEVDPGALVIKTPTSVAVFSGTAELLILADGTIIARLKVSWIAADDSRVAGYEVQYKKSIDSIWLSTADVIGAAESFIYPVESGVKYDVRIRSSDNARNTSSWVIVNNHTALGKSAPPSNVAGFTVLQNGEMAIIKWVAVTDVDLSGYDIRYGPQNVNDFNNATPLTTITKGTNVTSGDVASGNWRFYIKAVDTSGNFSVSAATFDMSFVSSFDIIYQHNEAPAWAGILTNFVKHYTGVLVPDSQDANSTANNIFDIYVKNPYLNCYYEAAEIDSNYDDDVRVWGDIISSLGVNEIGIADPALEIDYRKTADSYNGFELWSVGVVSARYIKHRINLDTSKGIAFIQQFNPTVDLLEWSQKGANIIVPAGGLTITYPKPFHTPPLVKVQMQGGSALFVTRETITKSSFLIHVWNTNGAEVGGVIDWEATGV